MNDTSGWSPAGIVSLAAIAAGIVLLVVYAVRRGMFHRELDGTDEAAAIQAADDPTALRAQAEAAQAGAAQAEAAQDRSAQATQPARRSNAGRPLGVLGAVLLVIGLGLGLMVATGTWGAGGTTPPSGASGQEDCAANWDGCPKATPQP